MALVPSPVVQSPRPDAPRKITPAVTTRSLTRCSPTSRRIRSKSTSSKRTPIPTLVLLHPTLRGAFTSTFRLRVLVYPRLPEKMVPFDSSLGIRRRTASRQTRLVQQAPSDARFSAVGQDPIPTASASQNLGVYLLRAGPVHLVLGSRAYRPLPYAVALLLLPHPVAKRLPFVPLHPPTTLQSHHRPRPGPVCALQLPQGPVQGILQHPHVIGSRRTQWTLGRFSSLPGQIPQKDMSNHRNHPHRNRLPRLQDRPLRISLHPSRPRAAPARLVQFHSPCPCPINLKSSRKSRRRLRLSLPIRLPRRIRERGG